MTAAITETSAVTVAGVALVVEFPVATAEIDEAKKRYAGLEATTTAGYEEVRLAIAHLRTSRTAIEKRRKQLKAPGLEFHRKVDAMAELLTGKIEEVEAPLRRKKEDADADAALARRAEEDRIRAEEAAAKKAAQEAEDARLKAEADKLAAQRAEFEAAKKKADEERAAKDAAEKAERDRVAAEQREAQAKIDAARAEVEAKERVIREREAEAARVESARVAKETADREAAERAERDRIAAEEAAAAERARLESLRPDLDKLRAYAGSIRELGASAPAVQSDEARAAVLWVTGKLDGLAEQIEKRFPLAEVA